MPPPGALKPSSRNDDGVLIHVVYHRYRPEEIETSTGRKATEAEKTAAEQKPPKTEETEETPKQKLTLYVTADQAKRLAVHATMLETDRSALVGDLIKEHLKRFRVQDLNRPDEEPAADTKKPDPLAAEESTRC